MAFTEEIDFRNPQKKVMSVMEVTHMLNQMFKVEIPEFTTALKYNKNKSLINANHEAYAAANIISSSTEIKYSQCAYKMYTVPHLS